MNDSGREGNSSGRSLRRRGADSRQSQEFGASYPNMEKSSGRFQTGRQGSHGARESRQGSGDASRKRPEGSREGASSRRRSDKSPDFLFHGMERIPYDRPKWTAPQPSTEPIPHPVCPYCDKPIKDISAAMTDKASGQPVHFDCAAARIAEGETLENGDSVVYLGGGRFGIVHFPGMIRDALRGGKGGDDYDTRNFHIKKILEWENKENRASWRRDIEDHFSVV